MVLGGQFIALQKLRVILSLDVWRVSRTTFYKAQRFLSIIKSGLPHRGFALIVLSLLHFMVT
jgi:hypothetical protein